MKTTNAKIKCEKKPKENFFHTMIQKRLYVFNDEKLYRQRNAIHYEQLDATFYTNKSQI